MIKFSDKEIEYLKSEVKEYNDFISTGDEQYASIYKLIGGEENW